jgi:hypothetical protein
MDRISELKSILGKSFAWSKPRLDCFARMLLALFAVRTVNLREIAVAFGGDALIDSRYKRIKRFFAKFSFNNDQVAQWIFNLFFSHDDKKLMLTMDRTNWFWGKSKINVLMLAIKYEGVAIPLMWELLDKAGNATALEHQAILQRFIHVFGKDRISGVLADREFGSGSLFGWCNAQDIPFYIRIKEDSLVRVKRKKICKAVDIFKGLPPKDSLCFNMNVSIYDQLVYLAGSRSETGELMIVATNQPPKHAILIYLMRWEIENLFGCLKSKGFCFEETHITQKERIDKLITLLAFGFCWAHKVGEWRATIKSITFNKYRHSRRPQYTYFRYGLDLLRDVIFQSVTKSQQFTECLMHLIAPDPSSNQALRASS